MPASLTALQSKNAARDAIAGALPIASTGKVFYVDSVTGASGNSGRTVSQALTTIAAAVAKCTANKGDTIVVLPTHAESVIEAGTITVNVAGVTIIGLGQGTSRPTLTFGTATTATFLVSALNVTIRNLRFVNDIDSLGKFLDLTAGYTTVEDCEFVTSSTKEAVCFVSMTTTKDEFTFNRCRFFQPTDPGGSDGAASTGCFYLVDTEGLYINDCFFYGNFETAIVHNKTTAAKNVWLRNCRGTQLLSGAEVFTQVAAMEGGCQSCFFVIPAATDVTEALTWGTMSDKFFIDVNSCIGNDGAGGQLAVAGATAAS